MIPKLHHINESSGRFYMYFEAANNLADAVGLPQIQPVAVEYTLRYG